MCFHPKAKPDCTELEYISHHHMLVMPAYQDRRQIIQQNKLEQNLDHHEAPEAIPCISHSVGPDNFQWCHDSSFLIDVSSDDPLSPRSFETIQLGRKLR